MDKRTKIWLITAALLTLAGCTILAAVMSLSHWDLGHLSTTELQTAHYEIHEEFHGITVETDTADIVFVPSGNDLFSVDCYEYVNAKHSVAVIDGTLVIRTNVTKKWYEYIGIHFDTPRITLSIPCGAYGELSVKSDTGLIKIPADFSFDSIQISESTGSVTCMASALGEIKIQAHTGAIRMENATAGSLDLSVSTGRIEVTDFTCEEDIRISVSTGRCVLTNIRCMNFASSGSTGDLSLTDVLVQEKITIKRSTGDVKLDRCDSREIFIETDTGDVSGTLLSEKVFITDTDTGSVRVPGSVSGGRCEITTSTGDIRFSIAS